MIINKEKTVMFYGDMEIYNAPMQYLCDAIRETIIDLHKKGCDTFLTTMDNDYTRLCIIILIGLRVKLPTIRIMAVVRDEEEMKKYKSRINQCDAYFPCYGHEEMDVEQFLLENSSHLIYYYNINRTKTSSMIKRALAYKINVTDVHKILKPYLFNF